eukprot:3600851-Pleurochrysis_carterae.AAC.1
MHRGIIANCIQTNTLKRRQEGGLGRARWALVIGLPRYQKFIASKGSEVRSRASRVCRWVPDGEGANLEKPRSRFTGKEAMVLNKLKW